MKKTELQISTIAKIPTKPASWRVVQKEPELWVIYAIYADSDEPVSIVTRRGEIKEYKTEKAWANDIKKVSREANVVISFVDAKEGGANV